jgi:hypothetical protein
MNKKIENEIDQSVDDIAGQLALLNITKRLLQLERDLSIPGVAVTDANRVDRILDMIEKENF